MTSEKPLNPKTVHDAAANLFWTFAIKAGVAGANQAVLDSEGRCLMEMPCSSEVLAPYNFQGLTLDQQVQFARAIAAEAMGYAVKEDNLLGVIYAEDADNGRAPSAQGIQTVELACQPKLLDVSGEMIDTIGLLCIRHPLPAVVFANRQPRSRVVLVENTDLALGFHLPIFLANVTTIPLAEDFFVLTGVFQIPVPSVEQGEAWNKVIQNSTRFVSGIKFYSESGSTNVEVSW